jgi:hypothetical protein
MFIIDYFIDQIKILYMQFVINTYIEKFMAVKFTYNFIIQTHVYNELQLYFIL